MASKTGWRPFLLAALLISVSAGASALSASAFVGPKGCPSQRTTLRTDRSPTQHHVCNFSPAGRGPRQRQPWGRRIGARSSGTALGATSSQDLKLRKRRKGSTATDPEEDEAVAGADRDVNGDEPSAKDVAVAAKEVDVDVEGSDENPGDDDDREAFESLAETSGLVRLQRAAARALAAREASEGAGNATAAEGALPPPEWTTPGCPAGWGGNGTGAEGAAEDGDGDGNGDGDAPAGSLRRLNRNIDRRLRALEEKRRMGGPDFGAASAGGSSPSSRRASFEDFDDAGMGGVVRGRTPVSAVVPPVRDSMSSLLLYNHVRGDWAKHASASTFNVAVVFGKRLVRDQITVEYASRIRTLARLFKEGEPLFRPSLVCFCGGVGPGNHVSDADAGYIFFRHMCEAQGIDLDGVSVYIDSDPASNHEGIALQHVTNEVRKKYLREWLERSPAEEAEAGQDDVSLGGQFGSAGGIARKRKKVAVHFSLVSTEYHLCNLNDVHHRSPRQSLLKPIEELKEAGTSDAPVPGPYGRMIDDSSVSVEWDDEGNSYIQDERRWDDDFVDRSWDDDDEEYRDPERPYRRRFTSRNRSQSTPRIRGVVETSWSFQYATYPFLYAKDDAVVFLGKCFLLGEELTPLLANMKGVVDQKEFFQRDNYLMLASIRRSLVSHVERLHSKRTSLKTALREYSSGKRDVAAVLEGALLSLGRCVDVVRPAGLLVSSVTKSEWTRALGQLRHSMEEIRGACDPDRPLRPTEWGKLVDDEAATLDIGTDRRSVQQVPIQSVVAAAAAAAAVAAAGNDVDEEPPAGTTGGEGEEHDGELSMFADE